MEQLFVCTVALASGYFLYKNIKKSIKQGTCTGCCENCALKNSK